MIDQETKVLGYGAEYMVDEFFLKELDKKNLCFCISDATEKTAKQKGFHNTF